MDRRVLPLLIALSGLSHPSPEPQQKFPEDFYSGGDSDFEHPDDGHSLGSFSLGNFGGPSSVNIGTSPVHGSTTALQSNVDLRLLYHSLMNPTRTLHGARQHAGHSGYTHTHSRTPVKYGRSRMHLPCTTWELWIITCRGPVASVHYAALPEAFTLCLCLISCSSRSSRGVLSSLLPLFKTSHSFWAPLSTPLLKI